MPGVEELEWVREDQQYRLAELIAIRGEWREWLPAELDQRWPEWRHSTEEVLGPWLDQVIDQLLLGEGGTAESETAEGETAEGETAQAPGGQPAGESVATLHWVTAEQQAYLDQLTPTRGDWHEWLPFELDAAWAQWRESTAETLGPWLSTLLPSLAPAATTEADPSDLAWVTPEQAARLDTLTPTRGDWHAWLPQELDKLGAWRQSAPDALAPWLDGIIPMYLQPSGTAPEQTAPEQEGPEAEHEQSGGAPESAKVELTEQEQAQAETVATSVLDAVQDNPEMAEILANLTAEQLAEMLTDVAAARQ